MALVSIKLNKFTFKDSHPHIKGFILPHNPAEEKTSRKIIQKFLKKHVKNGDKLLVFADQEKDKLGNLVILQQECDRANIELTISLYFENTNSEDKESDSHFFREVDISLSQELYGMKVW